jgi:hypothetical protein
MSPVRPLFHAAQIQNITGDCNGFLPSFAGPFSQCIHFMTGSRTMIIL